MNTSRAIPAPYGLKTVPFSAGKAHFEQKTSSSTMTISKKCAHFHSGAYVLLCQKFAFLSEISSLGTKVMFHCNNHVNSFSARKPKGSTAVLRVIVSKMCFSWREKLILDRIDIPVQRPCQLNPTRRKQSLRLNVSRVFQKCVIYNVVHLAVCSQPLLALYLITQLLSFFSSPQTSISSVGPSAGARCCQCISHLSLFSPFSHFISNQFHFISICPRQAEEDG